MVAVLLGVRLAPALMRYVGLMQTRGTLIVYSSAGVVAQDLYSALVAVVMLTTFVAPPWLEALYGGVKRDAR